MTNPLQLNFKALEHFLALDLKTMTLQQSHLNEFSWVFVATWPDCKSKSQLDDFLRPAFLISTQTSNDYCTSTQLSKCDFSQLSVFFSCLYRGSASCDTMQRGHNHLRTIASLPRDLKFQQEREMFCDQFNEKSPRIGLEGFLHKMKTPFSNINQKTEALKILSDWLLMKHRDPHK